MTSGNEITACEPSALASNIDRPRPTKHHAPVALNGLDWASVGRTWPLTSCFPWSWACAATPGRTAIAIVSNKRRIATTSVPTPILLQLLADTGLRDFGLQTLIFGSHFEAFCQADDARSWLPSVQSTWPRQVGAAD